MSRKSTKAIDVKAQVAAAIEATGERAEFLGINDAALALGLSQVYVRNAVRHGDLKSVLVPVREGAKTMKHQISRDDLDAWTASRSNRSRREDGRSKYTLYATTEEKATIEALLLNNNVAALIEKAYVKHTTIDVEAEAAE